MDGIIDVRDEVLEWLDKPSSKRKGMTNIEMIVLSWNLENPTNEIDDSFAL